jgi:hypothetical protein
MSDIDIDGQFRQNTVGNTDSPAKVIAGWRRVTNDGQGSVPTGNGGYREDYTTYATAPQFDVGHSVINVVESPTAEGAFEGRWESLTSPRDPNGRWSATMVEWNIGNRCGDQGYRDNIAGERMTGGHLTVATCPGQFSDVSYNCDFAYATAGATDPHWAGQFYNGFLVDVESIAKDGRAIMLNGDTEAVADKTPFTPLQVTRTWQTGIKMDTAKFKDGNAMTLNPNQKIAWTDGTEGVHLTPAQIKKLKKLLA